MKCLLLTRRGGERGNTLKLLTIVDSSATNSASFFFNPLAVWTGEKEREQTFKLSKENRHLWYCSTVNVRSIKMKCV